jgi:hypothetical protein
LRVERALIAANPPMPMGVTAASVPPQIIASASPRWIMRNESPIEWALVVHAVAVAEFGPLAPLLIDTYPDARLMIVAGMKKGEMRRGPCSNRV